MKTIIEFMRSMFGMKAPWPIWIGFLMALNMIVPIFFIETPEAKAVLLSTFAGAGLMMLLFNKYGFVRLLGLGHIFWLPIVIWLGSRFSEFSFTTPLEIWFLLIVGVNTISLILDAIDVVRYFNGDREPMVTS
ncbi:MAG: hypothetical protein HOK41_18090 [Nitrospina sp.]|jgi:hypothetical protein|nr:hypothetical protein [Nitrospina sp.]